MVSMKPHETIADSVGENPYGYGLRIHLDAAQCKALGLDQPPPVGTRYVVKALSFVSRGEQEDTGGEGTDKPATRVCLQITDLELQPENGRDMAQTLYPS